MGYRFNDKPFDPEKHLNVYPVRANALLNLAFGCYYLHGHNDKLHDHIGWPNPDNPDHICQIKTNGKFVWPFNDKTINFDEIDLVEEGYENVIVTIEPTGITFDEPSETDSEELITKTIEEYFDASASIDQETPNIIRFKFGANFLECGYDVENPIDVVFTIYVCKPKSGETNSSGYERIDAVEHGIIRILPASSYSLTQ